jgi:membrane fusion protein (multidrug efflux system)
MRSLLVYLLAAVIVVVGLAVGFPELWRRDVTAEAVSLPPAVPPVVVAVAAKIPFAAPISALGTIRANESVAITPNRSDHVAALHFEDGDVVEAGQLLVELESAEERALLGEAKALLAEREAEHARTLDLVDRGISAQSDLDRTQSMLLAARARVTSIEAALAELEVRAPFAGTLGLRQVSLGALIQPQTVVTTLDDLSVVKVDFTIPGTRVGLVQVGMKVTSRCDAWPGRTFPGEVLALETRLDPRSRSATVRAAIPNPDGLLRPGMLAMVEVDRGEAPVLQVPEEALVPLAAEQFVFVVDTEGVARRTKVEIGRRRVGFVEILDGIADGARVVVEGIVRVRPDAPVAVVAERSTDS